MSIYAKESESAQIRVPSRPSVEQLAILAAELFALGSVLHFSLAQETYGVLQSFETMLLILLPLAAEHVLRCKISSWLYVYVTLYALGPLLGHSYKLFYTTGWWDKLLHCSGGMIFALVGYYLPLLLNKNNAMTPAMRLAFALCFSITVSALWEFAEYGSDMLLGTDSQNDTYINGIHSYFLGKSAGQLGSIDGISQVMVNGMELPGYVDIGLIDTMGDMLIETLGASLGCGLLAADQGKHPAVRGKNDLE